MSKTLEMIQEKIAEFESKIKKAYESANTYSMYEFDDNNRSFDYINYYKTRINYLQKLESQLMEDEKEVENKLKMSRIEDGSPTSLLLFFTNLLEGDFNSVDALLELKECAMNQWENGELTDSQHCDIEAYLDHKLSLL